MLSVTGKKAMITIRAIFGSRSYPNHRISSGARAIFGTFWNSTMSG